MPVTADDPFKNFSQARFDPIRNAVAITPSDTDELAVVARAVYIGGAGDLVVVMAGDAAAVTLVGLAPGVWHPIQARKILAAGTSATRIIAGY